MYPQSALTGGGTRDYYPNEIARRMSSEGVRPVGSVTSRPRGLWRRVATSLATALSPSRGGGEGAVAEEAATRLSASDPATSSGIRGAPRADPAELEPAGCE